MSIHVIEESGDPSMGDDKPTMVLAGDTPLAKKLGDLRMPWMLDYACNQYEFLHGRLGDWRGKMTKWEKYSKGCYEDRQTVEVDEDNEEKPNIFHKSNETLSMSSSFVDYFVAQCRNDLFGTDPWLAAQPVGRSDEGLADSITKHSQWKVGSSNTEKVLRDAIGVAGWGGTAFVKARWHKEEEEIDGSEIVLHDKETGLPVNDPNTGDFIYDKEAAEALGMDGDTHEFRRAEREETVTIYDNALLDLIHYNDIAFDPNAQDLDLYRTDVFCKFKMGVLDAINEYGIDAEKAEQLRHAMAPKDSNIDYSSTTQWPNGLFGMEDNPEIELLEGFIRCDPFATGKPIRIHIIFSHELRALFRVDYLNNVTPGAMLPVFPVRINRESGKVLGCGFFEKYESANDAIDRQYNGLLIRHATAASMIAGVQEQAFKDPDQASKNLTMDPHKPIELAPDKTLEEAVQFKVVPSVGKDGAELLNQMLQMNQMKSGITSAAQGELKGVPNANTATGVRELMSRGSILLKSQIDEVIHDVTQVTEFVIHLIYANHDAEETFNWGEGEDIELLTIEPNDVRGLKINAKLTLVQAQNAAKLENAQLAIQILQSYLQVPETDKQSQRPAYIQAIASLGFRNADAIVRQATLDPEGLLAVMPPEYAQQVQDMLVANGDLQPPEEEQPPA